MRANDTSDRHRLVRRLDGPTYQDNLQKRLEICSPWHMSRSDPFWPQSHRAHPLTPVSPPMPLTNHFSVNANRASRGTTTIALAAITKPQFVP